MKEMKILFILDLYKPHIWWVEVLFENVISGLEERGNSVVILTSRFEKGLSSYEKFSKNIEIYRVWHNRYDFMFFALLKWVKLSRECDMIHTTTYNSAIPASLISLFSGKKVVLTVHEIFWKLWYRFLGWKWFFFKLFESIIFKFPFDKIICVSNYTKNSLRIHFGIVDKKLSTVYNGIDYKRWDKNNFKVKDIKKIQEKYNLNKSFSWLYFWRPGISKGLEYFIFALPGIVKKIKNFKAVLIVSENDKKRVAFIKSLICDLKVEEFVEWVSSVDNKELGNYILACDFVVVPSLVEWFGFSAAETCALSQKLLVSSVASLPEVVSGKVNFMEPWNVNDIEKWVLNFFLGDYKEVHERKFFWDDNIEKTLGIYNVLLWKSD
jgi:glycosyltransferase involved in cell wall biosynthesis